MKVNELQKILNKLKKIKQLINKLNGFQLLIIIQLSIKHTNKI